MCSLAKTILASEPLRSQLTVLEISAIQKVQHLSDNAFVELLTEILKGDRFFFFAERNAIVAKAVLRYRALR